MRAKVGGGEGGGDEGRKRGKEGGGGGHVLRAGKKRFPLFCSMIRSSILGRVGKVNGCSAACSFF